MVLSEYIFNKYCVKNPELIERDKILQKHVNIYKKLFVFYEIICKWKLLFVDTTIHVKSKKMHSNGSRCGLIRFLIRKIEYFRRQRLRFSHILEMNITFTTSLDLMTYEHYIIQPMQMVEKVLKKKLYKNPELVKMLIDVHLVLHMGHEQITLDKI